MTGGGPAGASHIWITADLRTSPSAGIRFGLASAYSVILFIIMMALGYFYVKALTGERRAPRRMTDRREPRDGCSVIAGALGLPGAPAGLRRPADGLDVARPRSRPSSPRCSIRRSGGRPSRRSSNYTTLLSPEHDVGQRVPALPLNSIWVSTATTVLGVAGRGAGGLCLLALPLSRSRARSSSRCWCATCSRSWSS